MIESVLENLYRIEIPLPGNPLRSLNSYLVRNNGRALIIDTGMNRPECEEVMRNSLRYLDVNLKKTDFFITHCHVDHTGLMAKLIGDDSKVYFNGTEARIMNADDEGRQARGEKQNSAYLRAGYPPDVLEQSVNSHPARRFGGRRRYDFTILADGDLLEVGDYTFRVIETPGHSPDHLCLYEEKQKVLISGDHILFDITPNIAYWPELDNPLEAYLNSLEKVNELDVDVVLPGHRSLAEGQKDRIRELKEHHRERLQEVIKSLEDGDKNAFEVAPWISWSIKADSWADFPPAQKWFAVGETMSHLKYLEDRGQIERHSSGSVDVFSLVK